MYRFVYVQEDTSKKFNMQFGTQVSDNIDFDSLNSSMFTFILNSKCVSDMHRDTIHQRLFFFNFSNYFILTYVQVAAHILGQPEKAFWKNCVLAEKDEIELAEKFRDAFEPFDFAL